MTPDDCADRTLPQPSSKATLNNRINRLRISEGIDVYLTTISGRVPTTTYISQKQNLNKFKNWLHFEPVISEGVERIVVRFLEHLCDDPEYAVDTISGYVWALSNFIGYVQYDDPELVAVRLLRSLQENPGADVSRLAERILGVFTLDNGPSGASKREIKQVITYLRQSRFGSRVHAFVETILSTRARPCCIQQVDCTDFDSSSGILKVGISEQFLVGKYSLVTMREAEISDECGEVVREYIKYDRTSTSVKSPQPLFTTSQGRASQSTLRRSLKKASGRIISRRCSQLETDNARSGSGSPKNNLSTVLPRDIWWYALSDLV